MAGHEVNDIRDLVLHDLVALESWPVVVDDLVASHPQNLRIKRLLRDGRYEEAVLKSLRIYESSSGRLDYDGLVEVLKKRQLNRLAGNVDLYMITRNRNDHNRRSTTQAQDSGLPPPYQSIQSTQSTSPAPYANSYRPQSSLPPAPWRTGTSAPRELLIGIGSIREALASLQYNSIESTMEEILSAGKYHSNLNVFRQVALGAELITLEGPFPNNADRHCFLMLSIMLPRRFPAIPPVVEVVSDCTRQNRVTKYVDYHGKVNVAYLDDWNEHSGLGEFDLATLIQILSLSFEEEQSQEALVKGTTKKGQHTKRNLWNPLPLPNCQPDKPVQPYCAAPLPSGAPAPLPFNPASPYPQYPHFPTSSTSSAEFSRLPSAPFQSYSAEPTNVTEHYAPSPFQFVPFLALVGPNPTYGSGVRHRPQTQDPIEYVPLPTVVTSNGNPSADAKLLKTAIKGFEPEVAAIISVLTKRTNAERLNIERAYNQSFGKDLIEDLKSELGGRLYVVIQALMTPRDQYIAQVIRNAMSGIGTSSYAWDWRLLLLMDVLCSSTNHELQEINSAYTRLFNTSIESDLSGKTSVHFRRLLITLKSGGRSEGTPTDGAAAWEDARSLLDANVRNWGTDESPFNAILATRSWSQLRLIFHEYEKIIGHSIGQTIQSKYPGDVERGLLALVKCTNNLAVYFAERLYNSVLMVGGPKDEDLIFIIVTRSEVDLETIKQEYHRLYNRSLARDVFERTGGDEDYKHILLGLIG